MAMDGVSNGTESIEQRVPKNWDLEPDFFLRELRGEVRTVLSKRASMGKLEY